METEGQWWKSQLAADIHQALRIKVSFSLMNDFAFIVGGESAVLIQMSLSRPVSLGLLATHWNHG